MPSTPKSPSAFCLRVPIFMGLVVRCYQQFFFLRIMKYLFLKAYTQNLSKSQNKVSSKIRFLEMNFSMIHVISESTEIKNIKEWLKVYVFVII